MTWLDPLRPERPESSALESELVGAGYHVRMESPDGVCFQALLMDDWKLVAWGRGSTPEQAWSALNESVRQRVK